MWPVNETLAFDGKAYRVLFTETSYFYWIAIDEDKGLPERVYFDECRNWVDEGRIEKIPDPYSYLQGESWTKESNAYQKRQNDFDLIKPIVDGEGAFDKRVDPHQQFWTPSSMSTITNEVNHDKQEKTYYPFS